MKKERYAYKDTKHLKIGDFVYIKRRPEKVIEIKEWTEVDHRYHSSRYFRGSDGKEYYIGLVAPINQEHINAIKQNLKRWTTALPIHEQYLKDKD